MTTVAVCPLENCNLSVDVILTSSDGISLGGHIQNLNLFSEGFCGIGQPQDVVEPVSAEYQESADVLRVLLRFMHSEVPSDLRELPFTQLKAVAEAVNKYIVYHAIPYCSLLLQQRVDEDPLFVLEYSFKHNDKPLQELASKLTLHLSAAEVYQVLDFYSRGFLTWAERRKEARTRVICLLQRPPVRIHKGGYERCDKWFVFLSALIRDVLATSAIVDKAIWDKAIQREKSLLGGCHYCGMVVDSWNMIVSPAPSSDIIVQPENEYDQVREAFIRERAYDRVAAALCDPPLTLHKGGVERCEGWAQFYTNFALRVINTALMEMPDFEALIRSCNHPIKECRHCAISLQKWNLSAYQWEDD